MMKLVHSFSKQPLCSQLSDVNPEWFFSEDIEDTKTAQSICSHCPIKRECLDWAISIERKEKYVWGVYGGLTSDQRKMLT